jgi:hypothetical protein
LGFAGEIIKSSPPSLDEVGCGSPVDAYSWSIMSLANYCKR